MLGVAALGGIVFAVAVAAKGFDGAKALLSPTKRAPDFTAPPGAQYQNMSALPHGRQPHGCQPHGGKPGAIDL